MPSWNNKIRVIAWDLDGTLYPNHPGLHALLEEEKKKRISEILGTSVEEGMEHFAKLYKQFGSNTKALTSLGINGEEFFVSLWKKFHLGPYIEQNLALAEALQALASLPNVRQVMITNSNDQETVKTKLGHIGVDSNVFHALYTSVDTGFLKPDPRVFEHVLQQEAILPTEMVYAGDRLETDIAPAQALGIHTLLIHPSGTVPPQHVDPPTTPDSVFSSGLEAATWLLQEIKNTD